MRLSLVYINAFLELSLWTWWKRVLGLQEDRAEVIIELKADGKTCAIGRGLFVAVKEGHPAYHRWH